MTIRWRQLEIILATLCYVLIIAVTFKQRLGLSPEQIDSIYGNAYKDVQAPFNLWRNVVIPDTATVLWIYIGYLCLNIYSLPLLNRKRNPLAGVLSIVVLVLLLVAGIALCDYFKLEYFYFRPVASDPDPIIHSTNNSLRLLLPLLTGYAIWLCFREFIIQYLERPSVNRSYRILIANQAGFAVIAYAGLLFIFVTLRQFSYRFELGEGMWTAYFFFIPPGIILYFINTYWLFPFKGEKSFLSSPVITRLTGVVALIIIPFWFLHFLRSHDAMTFLLLSWFFHLWIITPLSWLVYTQRKDKILQLRGLEAALGRSDANLSFLRSQINPHFLFNTLNTLYGTALQEQAGRTAEGIQRLGDMMRFMLHENHQEKIPMTREIEYMKNYIALQQLRIAASPEISIEAIIPEPPGDWVITPMLLIPFVENAFKHGISLRERSWINLSLRFEAGQLYFDIHNSLHVRQQGDSGDSRAGMEDQQRGSKNQRAAMEGSQTDSKDRQTRVEEERSGIGLENVRQRLLLAYPGRHTLQIHHSATEYFVHLVIHF